MTATTIHFLLNWYLGKSMALIMSEVQAMVQGIVAESVPQEKVEDEAQALWDLCMRIETTEAAKHGTDDPDGQVGLTAFREASMWVQPCQN
eukprot:scaffold92244_cov23-Prasinocladus_malaysianus.AAC.1